MSDYQNKGSYGGGNNGYENKNSGGYQNKGGYSGNGGGGGGFNRGGGGNSYANKSGYGGSGKPTFQKKEYTPEELKNIKVPITCVITGNDNFPDNIALLVSRLIPAIENKGIVIRTGGLGGIDQVVMATTREAELHIPFKGFNKLEAASQYNSEPCTEIARRFMPELDTLPNVPKATFAKNPRLILGRYLTTPAQLVIIWSEDGCEIPNAVNSRSGIAGHVAKIACGSGIRVINLQRPDAEVRINNFLESIYVENRPIPIESTGNNTIQPSEPIGASVVTQQPTGNAQQSTSHYSGQGNQSQLPTGNHYQGAATGNNQQTAPVGNFRQPSYDY